MIFTRLVYLFICFSALFRTDSFSRKEIKMFHTIIVEDDPMVASINRKYLSANPQFVLDGCFSNGQEALSYLKNNTADLAVIDYYMPVMNGIELVRSIKKTNPDTSVIMVTAANNSEDIISLLSQGVLDYIVKPFTYERFHQALERFIQIRSLKNTTQQKMTQEEIDRLLRRQNISDNETETVQAVKGIQPQTLQLLLSYMKEHASSYLTSDEIAKGISLSRITVRRYLNYLLEKQEIKNIVDYSTGGRPSLRYQLVKKN